MVYTLCTVHYVRVCTDYNTLMHFLIVCIFNQQIHYCVVYMVNIHRH